MVLSTLDSILPSSDRPQRGTTLGSIDYTLPTVTDSQQRSTLSEDQFLVANNTQRQSIMTQPPGIIFISLERERWSLAFQGAFSQL
jgi:hypothetical protein